VFQLKAARVLVSLSEPIGRPRVKWESAMNALQQYVRLALRSTLVWCVLGVGPAFALDKINMAGSGTSSDAIIFIAEKKGFFRDEGLSVNVTTFDSGVKMIVPLGTGDLDAATSSGTAALYNAVARGIDIKIVASSGSAPPRYGHNILIIRKDLIETGRYKQPTDIMGLKVSMPSPGSSATATLNAYLVKNGLSFKDIDPVYLSYPNQVAALASGKIDIGLTAEPQASQAIKNFGAVRISSDDVMDPYHEASVTLMSGKFMQKRPDAARRFMRAFLKAARFYNDGLADGLLKGPRGEDVVAILTEFTTTKDPDVYRTISPQGVDPNGHLNVAGLQRDLDFYKTQNWIEADVDVQQAIDLRFGEAALSVRPERS
jgi:NitT/TauT family transport system substrate-binding protein